MVVINMTFELGKIAPAITNHRQLLSKGPKELATSIPTLSANMPRFTRAPLHLAGEISAMYTLKTKVT